VCRAYRPRAEVQPPSFEGVDRGVTAVEGRRVAAPRSALQSRKTADVDANGGGYPKQWLPEAAAARGGGCPRRWLPEAAALVEEATLRNGREGGGRL